MNYQQSRAYIKAAETYGSILGLANMEALMARLGNPQDDLKFVHVAGTNGKGSVIAYLYTVLQEAGFRVGRYISPTIYSYRERMECSGKVISREQFARHITRIAEAIEEMTAEGLPHPTPFEIETAAAFLYFAKEHCDLVLLEVGMGGDLDATNIIRTTEIAVITSISMDHTAFLGNSLWEIAQKKAGILKKGALAATVRQEPEAAEALLQKCEALGLTLTVADGAEAETITENLSGQSFSWQGETYRLSLLGRCQKENAVLALCVLELLEKRGYATTLEQRKEGLLNAHWSGRFTVIHEDPLFLVDGAHNPGAARQLAASIEHYFPKKKIYYITGMFRDKDYRSVIETTAPYAEKVLTIAAPDNPRALSPAELAKAWRPFHKDVQPFDSPQEAVNRAFELAGEEDVILAFGSLAFIGDLSRAVAHGGAESWRYTEKD